MAPCDVSAPGLAVEGACWALDAWVGGRSDGCGVRTRWAGGAGDAVPPVPCVACACCYVCGGSHGAGGRFVAVGAACSTGGAGDAVAVVSDAAFVGDALVVGASVTCYACPCTRGFAWKCGSDEAAVRYLVGADLTGWSGVFVVSCGTVPWTVGGGRARTNVYGVHHVRLVGAREAVGSAEVISGKAVVRTVGCSGAWTGVHQPVDGRFVGAREATCPTVPDVARGHRALREGQDERNAERPVGIPVAHAWTRADM